MKADTVDLAAIFGQPVHYVVPLYQRPYVWNRELQWEPLWDDVRTVADRQLDDTPANDNIPHFLGAVVLEQSLGQVGMIGSRTVIDGQQRLTTLQLLIAAARSLAVEHRLEGPRKMFEKLLFNDDFLVRQKGDELKVFPTQRDRQAFREALGDGVVASTSGHRMHEAYRFFRSSIVKWAADGSDLGGIDQHLVALSTAVWKHLVVVTIDLDPGDNAQMIFETLNARGTPLLAGDLIKNHLFQTAAIQKADIDALYEQHWKGLDTDWWREHVQRGRLLRPRLDLFLNNWLAMVTGGEVVTHQLFQEFKRYLASGPKQAADVLAELARYGKVYETLETEPIGTPLGRFLYRLNTMEVTTAYPLLMWLLGPDGLPEGAERDIALGAIESWLVRRMLTRQTTKNYNTVFLGLLKSARDAAATRGTGPLGSDVLDYLAGLGGESSFWPTAGQVRAALRELPAYSVFRTSRLRMVLEALEAGMYSGLVEKVGLPTDLTVEHVLPQGWEANWPLPEGVDEFQARLDRDAAKHRIGNLTLVTGKLNPTLSNKPWLEKRDYLRTHSVMFISTDIRNAETWDEAAITERGERLSSLAIKVWPRPNDTDDEAVAPGEVVVVSPAVHPVGPPDPDNPTAFASPLGIADEVGVGPELRRIIEVGRDIGLWPRPDRYSVMMAPPADKRAYLFTVWPQWDEGGSFKLWKSPAAFAKWIPGVTLDSARAVLGASEEPGVLLPSETEAFLAAIRRLVPSAWQTGSFEERHAELLALGIDGLDKVPEPFLRVIDHRAGGEPMPALLFAAAAMGRAGVYLRPVSSKDAPSNFHVRHPRFTQIAVYATPRPGEIQLDYRLPGTNPTYDLATARDGDYGIGLILRDDTGLDVALKLLDDAIGRP